MTDFSILREPDPETKEDAYKLAMLAAQLDRLQNVEAVPNVPKGSGKPTVY